MLFQSRHRRTAGDKALAAASLRCLSMISHLQVLSLQKCTTSEGWSSRWHKGPKKQLQGPGHPFTFLRYIEEILVSSHDGAALPDLIFYSRSLGHVLPGLLLDHGILTMSNGKLLHLVLCTRRIVSAPPTRVHSHAAQRPSFQTRRPRERTSSAQGASAAAPRGHLPVRKLSGAWQRQQEGRALPHLDGVQAGDLCIDFSLLVLACAMMWASASGGQTSRVHQVEIIGSPPQPSTARR